jgi:hypothetical protein
VHRFTRRLQAGGAHLGALNDHGDGGKTGHPGIIGPTFSYFVKLMLNTQ